MMGIMKAAVLAMMILVSGTAMADICYINGAGTVITCDNGIDGTVYSNWKVGRQVGTDNVVACALVSGVWNQVGIQLYDTTNPPVSLHVLGEDQSDETITIENVASPGEACGGVNVVRLPLSWFPMTGNGGIYVYAYGGADTINGSDNDEYINCGEGNDYAYGAGGDDDIYGEGGYDRIWGEAGSDYISGGDLKDWLYGGSSTDDCYGDGGSDVCDAYCEYLFSCP
jgi:Ca2+-binding RTX toxin-like protein